MAVNKNVRTVELSNEPLTKAKRIVDAHYRTLDNETFYLVAKEMMTRCFNVMGLTLSEWRKQDRMKSPYAPRPIERTKKVEAPRQLQVVNPLSQDRDENID